MSVDIWLPYMMRFRLAEYGNKSVQNVADYVFKESTTKEVLHEESAIIDAIQIADPSVVSIVVTKDLPILKQRRRIDPFYELFGGDSFYNQLRGEYYDDSNEQETIKKEIGGGSGFIVSTDGLIVTNKHVVSDLDAGYTIVFNDETTYDAEVLARDIFNDIAVLRIKQPEDEQKEFIPLQLSDSDQLQVGQIAISIGNALGEYRNTVSTGIVSGLSRNIVAGDSRGSEYIENVIQTDAAINHGNSGGPLLNIKGEVIGVNVAVARGAQNIAFAIPVNAVKPIVDNVKKNGRIVRPLLGVRYIPVDQELAQLNNLSVDYGALVMKGDTVSELAVMPGSPAAQAGLKEFDIITHINDKKIEGNNTLARLISEFDVGDTITVKVLRNTEEFSVDIKLVEAQNYQ
jgi:serine protease Do